MLAEYSHSSPLHLATAAAAVEEWKHLSHLRLASNASESLHTLLLVVKLTLRPGCSDNNKDCLQHNARKMDREGR